MSRLHSRLQVFPQVRRWPMLRRVGLRRLREEHEQGTLGSGHPVRLGPGETLLLQLLPLGPRQLSGGLWVDGQKGELQGEGGARVGAQGRRAIHQKWADVRGQVGSVTSLLSA